MWTPAHLLMHTVQFKGQFNDYTPVIDKVSVYPSKVLAIVAILVHVLWGGDYVMVNLSNQLHKTQARF